MTDVWGLRLWSVLGGVGGCSITTSYHSLKMHSPFTAAPLTFILICNNSHYHLCARPHVERLNASSLSLQSPGGIALWAAFYSRFGKLILEAVSLLKVTG